MSRAERVLSKAVDHLISLQQPEGCWQGEMVWNTMILSQYVIVCRIVGRPIDDETRVGMIQHFQVTRCKEGGWGMHPESPPYIFFTALGYVALRLLGMPPENPLVSDARRWLHAQPGGLLAIPTWGKFWLSMIGLYDYRAVNPFPPELVIDRLYCHTRNTYQAIAFLYGQRFQADIGPIGGLLRNELFGRPIDPSTMANSRTTVAETDVHVRPGKMLRACSRILHGYERVHSRRLRRHALNRCFVRILEEQRNSRYQGLSPGNALLNCLAIYNRDPHHPELKASLDGLEYWRWSDSDWGVRFAGARSQSWDTAFALGCLASLPTHSDDVRREAIARAVKWLCDAQLREELEASAARDPIRGGWCFSDGAHRWPVSDCAAEAIAALAQAGKVDREGMREAVEFILGRQNRDGGFATYERGRAPSWLERLNPSEMFANCMVDRSYVECTGSVLHAFALVRSLCPAELTGRIDRATTRATVFLRKCQAADGSFEGSWGINYTYGTFYAIRGLRAAGVDSRDPALRRAAAWLVNAQKSDGGWGEHYTGSVQRRYVEHQHSQPVMTSWALLGLLDLDGEDYSEVVQRGIDWLCTNQRTDGSWEQGAVNGVFFGTGMLDYRLYPAYFPAMALARHAGRAAVSGG